MKDGDIILITFYYFHKHGHMGQWVRIRGKWVRIRSQWVRIRTH